MITTDVDFLRKNSKKRTNCLMCLSSDINEFLQKKLSGNYKYFEKDIKIKSEFFK